MTALHPYASLFNLATATAIGTSSNLIDWSVSWVLDGPGTLSITVPIADAGDSAGPDSFALSLLKAAGGADNSATPVPTLLEFSLDGGASFDSRRRVERPVRDISTGKLVLTEAGDDIWVLGATIGVERLTLTDCYLADVLGGNSGAVLPIDTPFRAVSASGALPYVQGILKQVVGAGWPAGSQARLQFTAVLDQTVAFLPTNFDAWCEYTSKAVDTIMRRLGGLYVASDTMQGARGHYVADSSDAGLNLSARVAGVVANGSPTPGSPGTLSNAAGGVARSLVIGNVGSSPALTFDGNAATPVTNETTTARLRVDGVTIEPDLSQLFGRAEFIGGASDAGMPGQGKITALTTLNNSTNTDDWTASLPLIGINVGDTTGGLYYTAGDNQLRPWPYSPAVPVLDLNVDVVNNVINMATPHGVVHTGTDIRNPTAWTQIGGLTGRVDRLAAQIAGSSYILMALVHGHNQDGVYRYGDASPTPGIGYNGWTKVLPGANIMDLAAGNDNHSFFFVDKNNQNAVYFHDTTAHTTQAIALPAGTSAVRLDRVSVGGTDTLWISTVGDQVGLYLLTYAAGSWINAITSGNSDGSLSAGTVIGRPPTVHRVVTGKTVNGVAWQVVACTNAGLFYAATLGGSGWKSANGQNGLGGVQITNCAIGGTQQLMGRSTQRLYATSLNEFYTSHNSSSHWQEITRTKLDLGPIFMLRGQNAAVSSTHLASDLPSNSVQTIGPSAGSPLGLAAATHLQTAAGDTLAAGFFIQRIQDEELAWHYHVVNSNCPFPDLMFHQVSEIEANELVTTETASATLLQDVVRWLGEHSSPQTILHLPSSFLTTQGALRTLRPTMQVAVNLAATITMRSSGGAVLGTTFVNYANRLMWVLAHTISAPRAGGSYAETVTEVGTVLRTRDISPDDLVAHLQQQVKHIKTHATRGRRK